MVKADSVTAVSMRAKELLSQTDNRWQIFQSKELQALAKVESSLMKGARRYIEDKGFIWINAPHITKATGSCENFNTVFKLDYFGKNAYLSQTAQLYLESLTPSLKKVWTIIHSFRAEPDADSRHLTEFPLIEIEFEDGFEELLKHIEGTIASMIEMAVIETKEELKLFGIDAKHISRFKVPYPRVTYKEALKMLKKSGMEINFGDDIKSVHERLISKSLGYKPFFITHWPSVIKFFNMRNNDEEPELANSCDLILPFAGEAVGGAEREHTHEKLKEKLEKSKMLELIKARGGKIEDFEWFLSFYKHNKVNLHSGFGMGFNRVTQSLLMLDDIRACTVFPQNSESYW